MTEFDIQNQLYRMVLQKGHKYAITNLMCYAWEADFLSCTKSDYVHEYEIKVTTADFRNDAKKTEKHERLKTGLRDAKPWYYYKPGQERSMVPATRPNYFWYVAPDGIIPVEEVPEYAGLMVVKVRDNNLNYVKIEVVRPAPLLHKEKIDRKLVEHITTSYYYRFWKLRMKLHEDGVHVDPEKEVAHESGAPEGPDLLAAEGPGEVVGEVNRDLVEAGSGA